MKLTVLCDSQQSFSKRFYPIYPAPIPLKMQEGLDTLRVIFTLGEEMDHEPLLSLQGFKQFDYLEIASMALAIVKELYSLE